MSDLAPSALLTSCLEEFERAPFLRRLGLEIGSVDQHGARLELPYLEANSNRGGNLHGGTHATLMLSAAELAVAASDRTEGAPRGRAVSLTISYLGAARGCGMTAEAKLVKRGRDAAHAEVEIVSSGGGDGQPAGALLARGRVTYAIATPNTDYPAPEVKARYEGGVDLDSALFLDRSPFLTAQLTHVLQDTHEGGPIIAVPCEGNAGTDGAVSDASVAALLDTAGSMAAATAPGVEPSMLGATLSLSMVFTGAPSPGEPVAAWARPIGVHGTSLTSEVEVWSGDSRVIRARGEVVYRIPRG